jgi:hypothetical protein
LKQVFEVEAKYTLLKIYLKKLFFEHFIAVSNSAHELIRCKSNLESRRLVEARISASNLTNIFRDKIVEIKSITDKYEKLLMFNAQLPSVSTVQDIEMNQSIKATFAVVT